MWIVHRDNLLGANEAAASQNPPTASCCVKAPPVLEFDPAGNVVGHWGGPGEGYDWPASNHGITIDHKGNVWIGANEGTDAHVLKFTKAGKFLMQFGKPGQNKGSNDTENFGRPAKIFVDAKANEAYIADGYGNKRVVVIDADTGKFKRYWGAYGNKPDDTSFGNYDPKAPPIKQFRTPVHCAELSNDGLVYVCDRPNDRIQIFKPDGTFVKEVFVATNTLGDGSVWDIAFSKDPQQKYLFLADGKNEKIYVMLRETMEILTTLRRRRPAARTVLRRAQHRARLEREHVHRRDLRGTAAAEVRLQGARARHEDGSGDGMADKIGRFAGIAHRCDRWSIALVAIAAVRAAADQRPAESVPDRRESFQDARGAHLGRDERRRRRQGRQVDLGRRALRREHVPRTRRSIRF